MTQATFDADPDVVGVLLAWQSPENPNITVFFGLILLGLTVIVAMIIAALVVVWVLVRISNRRRKLCDTGAPTSVPSASTQPLAPPPTAL